MGVFKGKESNNNPAQTAATAAPEAAKVEKKKWYEEKGNWGFEPGDVIYIGSGHPNGVADRFAEALGPSEKPNHIKARMQNEKTGELQRSEIVIDNQHLTLVAKDRIGAPVMAEHGDKFVLDEKGIYRTKEQMQKENEKMAARNKNKADNGQEIPQAQ